MSANWHTKLSVCCQPLPKMCHLYRRGLVTFIAFA